MDKLYLIIDNFLNILWLMYVYMILKSAVTVYIRRIIFAKYLWMQFTKSSLVSRKYIWSWWVEFSWVLFDPFLLFYNSPETFPSIIFLRNLTCAFSGLSLWEQLTFRMRPGGLLSDTFTPGTWHSWLCSSYFFHFWDNIVACFPHISLMSTLSFAGLFIFGSVFYFYADLSNLTTSQKWLSSATFACLRAYNSVFLLCIPIWVTHLTWGQKGLGYPWWLN